MSASESIIRPPIRTCRPSASPILLAIRKANGDLTSPHPILRLKVQRSISLNYRFTAVSPSNLVAFSVRIRRSHVIGTIGLHTNTHTISNHRRASTTAPTSARLRIGYPHGMMASTRDPVVCAHAIRPMTPSMSHCTPCRGDFEVGLQTCSSCGVSTGSKPPISPTSSSHITRHWTTIHRLLVLG